MVIAGRVVLIHGFWSSSATWDGLARVLEADPKLADFSWHRYGYPSPKLWVPLMPLRTPDYDDIAQALGSFLDALVPEGGGLAFVTHSQGGLILQRYLAWMLDEGRGQDLARIRSILMLACPHEGSDYLRSLRTAAGFGFHPQGKTLRQFDVSIAAARRKVLTQIVNATKVSARECPIPVHVYAGDRDNVVKRVSAQGTFPKAGVLPGGHSSIIDPELAGSTTAATISRHLVADFSATPPPSPAAPSGPGRGPVTITGSSGFQVGDNNIQVNS
ncbi:alpha/beta fold hydrolase [Micromonospora sp. NPDC006766]|uniref:esterase/lipase family protein n=1 Tax=Micromonospora sp. NPDC006766 TaxID=3154778 RepID=UPI0033C87152